MGFTDSQGTYHAFRSVIPLSLNDFRTATTGDVPAAASNGGLLALDSTPTLTGTAATVGQQLSWATGNVTQILTQIALPEDFDGREDVLVDLWVSSGTTNAATMGVLTNWNGASADITDSASDAATLSATLHKITARIAAADIPDTAAFVSIALVPPTHATDTIQLFAARLTYVAKIA